VVVRTGSGGWYPRSFVLTDIVGSVSLWERDAELMSQAVARHDAIIGREVAAVRGKLVRSKGEGDSTFSVFAHPAEAVAAAVAIQAAIGAEPWPAALPLLVRAGVHTGDAEPRNGDWYGPAVNRAARLRAVADGGQTLVSGVTAGLVAEHLPEDVCLLFRGRRVLRGLERPEDVWELVGAGDPRLAVPKLVRGGGPPLALSPFVIYAFGGYELDLARYQLRLAGLEQPIEAGVFDVLALLMHERGRVVPREELLHRVWGDRFLSESALASRIKAARRAIGDDGRRQELIRTVQGRGYQSVGRVDERSAATADAKEHPPDPPSQQIRFCTAKDGVRLAYARLGDGPPLVKAANWLSHLDYD
jgi:class 3 adenylate cyclase/DNA-binding winged helix-turn-helix (wHTH) protein